MVPNSRYSLIGEMLETPGILRAFDPKQAGGWGRAVEAKKRLLITGEGSSRIFPAKNMIDLALRRNAPWHICTDGARQASEYDLRDFNVMAASNSGRTRELIELFEKLKQKGIPRYGVTATPNSKLAEVSTDCRLLTCGTGKAVPSTKCVVEQALVYQSLLGGDEWKNQRRAADDCAEILVRDLPPEIIDPVKSATVIYFAGRNNGVAEELALKANEIARKKSAYLEGTYILHGVEEVMQKGETVVLIEPFKDDIEKYQSILGGAGVKAVAIASYDTPFPTVKIPVLDGFNAYLQLMAGWNILVEAALANGVDIDKPLRARKVGNEIQSAKAWA